MPKPPWPVPVPFRVCITFVPTCECGVFPEDGVPIYNYSEKRTIGWPALPTLEVVWQPDAKCPRCNASWDIRLVGAV